MSQNLEALERANEIRFARAELKRAIKAGDVRVCEILLSGVPEWLITMRFEDLCCAIPRFSNAHFGRLLNSIGARATIDCGSLTLRQRRITGEFLAVWESAAEIACPHKRHRERAGVI